MSGTDFDQAITRSPREEDQDRPPQAPVADAPQVLSRGSAAEVAELVRARPGQQAALFDAIHKQRGNAFAQQVLAVLGGQQRAAGPEPGADPDAREPAARDEVEEPDVEDTRVFLSRFTGDRGLEVVRQGGTLREGETGSSVRRLQLALHDLGFSCPVQSTFDMHTTEAVKGFQREAAVPRRDGVVDKATLVALDKAFENGLTYAHAAKDIAPQQHAVPDDHKSPPPTALTTRVHNLDAVEGEEARAVVRGADGGTAAEFHAEVQHDGVPESYGTAFEAMLRERITTDAATAKANLERHSHKRNREDMSDVAAIGLAAKTTVDAVFGSWAKSGELKPGVTLVDKIDQGTKERDAHAKLKDNFNHNTAVHHARYLANNDIPIKDLDKRHGADRSTGPAQSTSEAVVQKLAKELESALIDISIAIPGGSASPDGVVSMQLFEDPKRRGDVVRGHHWHQFGTLVHEYLHSLQHQGYRDYRDTLQKPDPVAYNTLTEGVDEFLTRAALATVNTADKTLRKQIEGDAYQEDDEPGSDAVARESYDGPFGLATRLVGTVGINNVYAAYFLGRADLVGG